MYELFIRQSSYKASTLPVSSRCHSSVVSLLTSSLLSLSHLLSVYTVSFSFMLSHLILSSMPFFLQLLILSPCVLSCHISSCLIFSLWLFCLVSFFCISGSLFSLPFSLFFCLPSSLFSSFPFLSSSPRYNREVVHVSLRHIWCERDSKKTDMHAVLNTAPKHTFLMKVWVAAGIEQNMSCCFSQ